ncbi:MAG: hypothetical protein AB7V58_00470 [Solirubrobacterales bacterium]
MGRSTAHRLFVITLAVLGVLAIPGAASPAGVIVVFGAHSGSHLTVTTNSGKIIVRGMMAHAKPRGCHLSADRMQATCPLAGASAIEIDMGPAADFVEVADPLPFPVVAHLGMGSDKFIGNDEPDDCYSEGSRRNRCIGRGGNDVCITGQKNSDCVGGPGDDFCKTGAGSDGCWGGPGDDVCYMGPGNDGCHGGSGNDRLFGGPGEDQLYGGSGIDYCDGGPGWGRSHGCEAGRRR